MTEISLTSFDDNVREQLTVARAVELTEKWKSQLQEDAVVVTSVVLKNKTYSLEAAKVVADFLKPHLVAHVTAVDFSDVIAGLLEEPALQVLKCLCDVFSNCHLTEINLSDNALGDKGLDACEALFQKSSLQALLLENNGLASESMDKLADWLTEIRVDSSTSASHDLKVLKFYDNMIGEDGAPALCRILAASPKLEELRYSGCRPRTLGSQVIAKGFLDMGMERLVKLDLEGSHFGNGQEEDHGVHDLARALQGGSSLTHVVLTDCDLYSEGMELVMAALAQAKAPLVELDVSENEMGREGAPAVGALLAQVSGTLEIFACDSNELTSLGVKDLVDRLTSQQSILRELSLKENMCGHMGAMALCNSVLPRLEKIQLDENSFLPDDVKALETAFGKALMDMTENDDEEDVDADLEPEDDDEEVDELAAAMTATKV